MINLGRMNRIRNVDPDDDSMIADAGCILADIQAAAAAVDRLFPMSLGAEGSCQIGGNIATNAGGTSVLRYGNMRDLVLGVEVVLADGSIWDGLRTLRKNNSGYDLKDLMVGSEGTLGIVTGAALRLFPRPSTTLTAMLATSSMDVVLRVGSNLRKAFPGEVTALEVMSNSEMTEANVKEGMGLTHDIAVPIARIGDFVSRAESVLAAQLPGVRPVVVGHLGDGNLHYIAMFSHAAWSAVTDKPAMASYVGHMFYDIASDLGGTFSAEHGIGSIHVGDMTRYKPPAELAMMRKIKAVLDPANLLNPGRVLPRS